jgi:Tfp pilus assembly protein PilX
MRTWIWGLAASVVWAVSGSPALAQTVTQPVVTDNRTDAERHQDRAEALRRAAEDRVRANLGYPSVQRDPSVPPVRNPTPAPFPAPNAGATGGGR